MSYNNRYLTCYNKNIKKELGLILNCKNVMEIPSLKKIVLHIGFKDISTEKRKLVTAFLALEIITGQKPILTKSKKAVSILKIQKDMIIGCKVTLRRKIMYEFLDKLITITLPRINDFPTLKKQQKINLKKNYTFKLDDLLIFHELETEYDRFYKLNNLNITFETSSKQEIGTRLLLRSFLFPLSDKKN